MPSTLKRVDKNVPGTATTANTPKTRSTINSKGLQQYATKSKSRAFDPMVYNPSRSRRSTLKNTSSSLANKNMLKESMNLDIIDEIEFKRIGEI